MALAGRTSPSEHPSSHAPTLGQQQCSKVSGGNREPPKVFVEAFALLFERVKHLVEPPPLRLGHTPSSYRSPREEAQV
jgi:hypothetical protein